MRWPKLRLGPRKAIPQAPDRPTPLPQLLAVLPLTCDLPDPRAALVLDTYLAGRPATTTRAYRRDLELVAEIASAGGLGASDLPWWEFSEARAKAVKAVLFDRVPHRRMNQCIV